MCIDASKKAPNYTPSLNNIDHYSILAYLHNYISTNLTSPLIDEQLNSLIDSYENNGGTIISINFSCETDSVGRNDGGKDGMSDTLLIILQKGKAKERKKESMVKEEGLVKKLNEILEDVKL